MDNHVVGGQRREGMDISAFFGFLRRRGLIILLAVVVGAIAGFAISKSKDKEYTGKATVLLRGNASNQGGRTTLRRESPRRRRIVRP
jgi:uncharacterized protein involved in exopolysaccharide biosynthesis